MASQQTAKTHFVDANGAELAYRRLGRSSGIPLVMHIHFRGTMDYWDPALINRLAAARPVILFDNSGVGESTGTIPPTFKGWAQNVIALCEALSVTKIDLLGFSMGGATAQMVALEAPDLVRKLILAGTGPSFYPGMPRTPRGPFLQLASADAAIPDEVEASLAASFYPLTDEGRAAAKASWERISERRERSGYLDAKTAEQQAQGWRHWTSDDPTNSHPRLGELKMPVFVANGDFDALIHTDNSWELAKRIPNAHLHIYPNSGHGFLFQYADLFAAHVNLFLDDEDGDFMRQGTAFMRARI